MSERIDHAAAAREWVTASEKPMLGMHETAAVAAVAQVHATLALVEQQRIANLIALAQFSFDGYEPNAAQLAVFGPGVGSELSPISRPIREALGL